MVSEASLEPELIAMALRKEIEFAITLVKPGTKGDIQSAIRWMAMRVQQLEKGRSTSNAQNDNT